MLITTVDSLEIYKGLSPGLREALEYLECNKDSLASLETGRYDIRGEQLYMLFNVCDTRNHDESLWETHREYIDVQYVVSGEELMFYAPRHTMKEQGSYDESTDKQNYADAPEAVSILAKPGLVAVFFPDDVHKANCRVGKAPAPVKKAVLKVKR